MEALVEKLLKKKVIVICRRLYGDKLIKLADALHRGGVDFMEVTFDQSDEACIDKTCGAIKSLKEHFGGEMAFGAGTVLNVEQVRATKQAGGEFVISPNVNFEVIRSTLENQMLSIPGAMTPSEILAAHDCGATFVKLFPAATLGMKYLKDIRAPISHVKLLATGGVTEDNFGEFLELGAVGAGISGRLTDKKCIEAGDFDELTRRAAIFAEITARR